MRGEPYKLVLEILWGYLYQQFSQKRYKKATEWVQKFAPGVRCVDSAAKEARLQWYSEKERSWMEVEGKKYSVVEKAYVGGWPCPAAFRR